MNDKLKPTAAPSRATGQADLAQTLTPASSTAVAAIYRQMNPEQQKKFLEKLFGTSNESPKFDSPTSVGGMVESLQKQLEKHRDKISLETDVTTAEIMVKVAIDEDGKKQARSQLEEARAKLKKFLEENPQYQPQDSSGIDPGSKAPGNRGGSRSTGPDANSTGSSPAPEQGGGPQQSSSPNKPSDPESVNPPKQNTPPQQASESEHLAKGSQEPKNARSDYRYKSRRDRAEAEHQEQQIDNKSAANRGLISRLVEQGNLGTERDVELVKEALECIHPDLLKQLEQAGYKFVTARDNVAHGIADTHGRDLGGSPIDEAEGIHKSGDGGKKIVVLTRMQDGKLTLDFSILMHEVGHAVSIGLFKLLDVVDKSGAAKSDQRAAHVSHEVSRSFEEAFQQEKNLMPRDYFKSPAEFLAETFAMYSIRPDEMRAKMPKTYEAYEKLRQNGGKNLIWPAVLFKGLLDFQKSNSVEPILEGKPGGRHILRRIEKVNVARRNMGSSGESHAFIVNGEPESVVALAKAMGSELCVIRDGRYPYDGLEGYIRVTSSMANDPEALFKKLAGSVGAILHVPEELNLNPQSDFFKAFKNFQKANNGVCHLLISGTSETFESYKKDFGSALPCHKIDISVASAEQIVTLIERAAIQESYQLSEEALAVLKESIKIGGTLADSARIWADIKAALTDRIVNNESDDELTVTADDIVKAGIKQEEDPLEKLKGLVGLGKAKEAIEGLVNRARLEKKRVKGTGKQNPTAMVFSGNPGTGKTTVARLTGQIMAREGVVKSPHIQMLKATELASLGKDGAKKEFLKGKNGTVFIDEFHQLDPQSNRDGKEIIDLLVPMLTDLEWKDTVFIFAGYEDKILELLKTDEGLQSRCSFVPFEDYTRSELKTITEGMLKGRELKYTPEVLDAICDRVDELQRRNQYPGNARDVEKTIEAVIQAQSSRLTKAGEDIADEEYQTIRLEDVEIKKPYTPEEVLAEFDRRIVGNLEIRKLLVDVQKAVSLNKKNGRDIFTNVPMAILLEGDPGTGKKDLADIIVKFYHSLGLLSSADSRNEVGGSFVGGYEGNSSQLATKNKCEAAFGTGLIVNQVKGIINSRAFSESSVAELKEQLSKNSKRFLFIGVDSAENMAEFQKFDSSLATKFKLCKAERLSLDQAKKLFSRLAKEHGVGFEKGYEQILNQGLSSLVGSPSFASGRDVKTLIDKLLLQQDYDEADGEGEHVFSNQVLQEVLGDFLKEVSRRPAPGGAGRRGRGGGSVAVASETQTQREQAKDIDRKKADSEVFKAAAKVNQKFSDLLNSDPQAFHNLQTTKDSEYYEELGKELNISTEKAFDVMQSTLEQIREEKTRLVEKFDYVCFACGGTNSGSCVYFSNSEMAKPEGGWVFSTEWLMINSLQGPYTVEEKE